MYVFNPSGIIAAASGVALVGLGLLLVLTIRPPRATTVAFGLFATAWGGQIIAANMVFRLAPMDQLYGWALLMVGLLILLHAPLLFFAATYPWPVTDQGRRRTLWFGVSLTGALVLLLLVLATEPRLFVAATATPEGVRFVQGPWFWPIATGSRAAFVIALFVVAWKLFRAKGAEARDQLALVCAAFLVYVSYLGSVAFHLLFLPLSDWTAQGGFLLRTLSSIAAMLLTAGIVWRVARKPDLPWRDLILVAGVVPFVVGVVEGFLRGAGVSWIDTSGVWRLAIVGLFAFAIARHRIFDAELRIREASGLIAYGIAFPSIALVVWTLLEDSLTSFPIAFVLFIGLAAACLPIVRLTRHIVERASPGMAETAYIRRRKLAVYRAALEELEGRAWRAKRAGEALGRLRSDLGISDEDHQRLYRTVTGTEVDPHVRVGTDQRYLVQRELGRGAAGRALLATDTLLGRSVVLKQPLVLWTGDKDAAAHFLREARVMARIQHPNIVTVHEITAEDPPSLVLEYVEGGSLKQLLDKKGLLPADQAVAIAQNILAALARMHKEGIIHRDLKPANVLLGEDATAKVSDFGVARAPPSLSGDETLAAPASQPGSVAYMSPEQVRGDEVDERSDVYSVGVLLYEMLSGRSPYDLTDRPEHEMRAIIQVAPPRLPVEGIGSSLEPVLACALDKDPSKRFPSATAMAAAITDCGTGLDLESDERGAPGPLGTPSRG